MKIAIVHDDLIQAGGAEKLLLAMSEIYPNAPIYTSIFNKQSLPSPSSGRQLSKIEIKTSWMQRLPAKISFRRVYFPLYPAAFESFDFSNYDVVLSSSTRFAHGVITKPETLHICYSNSPTRFLWETQKYLEYESVPRLAKIAIAPALSFLRIWDEVAAKRPDFWIANSKNVAAKLKKYYRVNSEVIYPFVDLEKFKIQNTKNKRRNYEYFLIVSRLLAWKRIDIVIQAVNRLKFKLKIAGSGPVEKYLRKLAKNSIEFLGEVSDNELVKLYQECRALILPQEEDFGINALEANACGKPVIAFKSGGALETLVSGITGIFFEEQTAESLIKAILKSRNTAIRPEDCRKNAETFSKENFQNNLKNFVEEKWLKHQKTI